MLFKAVCWPVHRRVIEPPWFDNTTQCSSALPQPAESAATEREVETGRDKSAVILSVNMPFSCTLVYRQQKCQGSKRRPSWCYWKRPLVCFGSLQGQGQALAMSSNNLQFYW